MPRLSTPMERVKSSEKEGDSEEPSESENLKGDNLLVGKNLWFSGLL